MDASYFFAIAWLGLLACAVIGYAVRLMRRSDYSPWESTLYLPTYLFGRLLWRVHFTNEPPAEIKSGAVLVANHKSSVDPFFVQLAARRRVHWMVAREYCEHFAFGPILRWAQVIPTNRSGMDTAATKAAIRICKEGRMVGMFPEGRLNHTRLPLVSIRSGAALVAQRASVPIIPLYIKGSPYRRTVWSPLLMPGHVAITFGNPINPSIEGQSGRSESPETASVSEATSSSSAAVGDPDGHLAKDGAQPHNEPTGATSDEDNAADRLILQWGQQVVAMAGWPKFEVELASKRKRRARKVS